MKARMLRHQVEEALTDTPVVFIRGARQTGKSTLAKAVMPKGGKYFTFDDEATRASAALDMLTFLRSLPTGSVIDEVQRVPQLFPSIKLLVDEHRTPGRFILTGSADVSAIPAVAESLSGRVELLTLYPFSTAELKGKTSNFLDVILSEQPVRNKKIETDREELAALLAQGGYPEIDHRKSQSRRDAWFNSYVDTIVQRDIQGISEIEALDAMPTLLSLLATRVGNLLNQSEVSRSLKLSASSVKRYLALLQATFLVDLVPAWSNNPTVRLRKAPKIFLNDSGLAAALRGSDLTPAYLLRDGSLLENYVANELRKLISWSSKRLQLSHYREDRGTEVDFVIEHGKRLTIGIEVKASATLHKDDAKGLLKLGKLVQTERYRGILLYGGSEVLPFGKDTWAVPIGALWEGFDAN